MPDINLVPLKFANSSFLYSIKKELSRRFKSDVNLLDINLNIDNSFSQERTQYFSSQIISDLASVSGKLNGKVLGITEVDLYIPVLTFVFGEAQLDGKHSLVSVCRLHEEFYSGESNDDLLYSRTMKEVLHELGHNFGLRHCIDWDCVMHSSQGIEEVDIKGSTYCKVCVRSIEGFKI
jgi:archaemetzincin